MARPSLGKSDPERLRATLLKFFKILARQIKTVGMIDAKSCHCACAHQLENKSVNGVKDLWQLDPNCGQIVHIKKATVINFLGGDPPKRQPIRLRVEQFIQRIKAARVARLPVDLRRAPFQLPVGLAALPRNGVPDAA